MIIIFLFVFLKEQEGAFLIWQYSEKKITSKLFCYVFSSMYLSHTFWELGQNPLSYLLPFLFPAALFLWQRIFQCTVSHLL